MRSYALYTVCCCLLLARCAQEKEKPVIVKEIVHDTVFIKEPLVQPVNADTSYLEGIFSNHGLVNVRSLDSSIHVNLRYADTSNLLHRSFYDGLRNAYLNCEAALMICNAQHFLKQLNPDYSLVILDASRPQHIQQLMWDSLKLPSNIKFNYLAPPSETSMHNYGCAVDVTILDLATNKPLDMGGEYDFFGKISEPAFEAKFLESGELSRQAYENRLLLRKVMRRARYNSIRSEWWHFSICAKPEALVKYKLIK